MHSIEQSASFLTECIDITITFSQQGLQRSRILYEGRSSYICSTVFFYITV